MAIGLLLAWLPGGSPAQAEMTLLFREMFATVGQLDEANPGTNFTRVEGIFHHRPGGPRLASLPAASADLRNVTRSPFAVVDLPTDDETRLFLCGWFHFKSFQAHGARLLAMTDHAENPGPAIFVEDQTLKAGSEYSDLEKVPFPTNGRNRWIFLGVAVVLHADRIGSIRFYSKTPGDPMQIWAAYDQVAIGLSLLGGFELGVRTTNSAIRCRLGAPAAYRFENDDFSDIVYPPDLLEPETGLTWYCNPATGDDANDGTHPDRAWASLAKINEESRYSGMLPADNWESGDTLIIDTRLAPLETKGETLSLATEGLNVRAAPGNEWIRVKSYHTLDPSDWEPTGIPNVYSTTDTEEHIVIWEDDKFLHHPTGPDLASVQAFLGATPGSFWTDGARLYLHPFGSTDPRNDGKRYERSYNYGNESAVMLRAPNVHVRDFHVGKTCLAHFLDNDSIGSYCFGTDGPLGNTRIANSYFYYGSKHNFGLTTGGPGDDVLVEDVQCEQGSPYVGPGGQTVFVSFNQQPLDLNITHRFHRCRTVMNAGLIGSSLGTTTALYPVFYVHNIGISGEPDQFGLIEFIDCDFGPGSVHGGGVKNALFESSEAGSVGFDGNLVINRSVIRGQIWCLEGRSVLARNSIFERSGVLPASPIAGHLDIQGCTFDGSEIVGISAQDAAFFTRSGPLAFVFRNNAIRLPDSARNFGFLSRFRYSDTIAMSNNAYHLGGNHLSTFFQTDVQVSTPTFPQWQAIGHDLESFELADLALTEAPPGPDSPLLNAGVELTPAEDFTGVPLLRRNDIGAFEGPPTRFDEWQFLHFSEEERDVAERGGAGGSLFGDGVPNLMKYALGLPARAPAAADLFRAMGPSAEGAGWVFTRNRLAEDLGWTVERSADLRIWEDAPDPLTEVLETDGTRESIRLSVPPSPGKTFFRVRIGIE